MPDTMTRLNFICNYVRTRSMTLIFYLFANSSQLLPPRLPGDGFDRLGTCEKRLSQQPV